MKFILYLFLLFLFVVKNINAQSYLPFQFGDTKWMVNEANMFGTKSYNYFSKDTSTYSINGNEYYRIEKVASPIYQTGGSSFFLRNDTIGKKVYYAPNGMLNTWEVLLYDFDVIPGDTLTEIYNPMLSTSDTVKIDSVITKTINTIPRRHVYLHSLRSSHLSQTRLWIEGIGSDYDLLYPTILFTDPSYSLMCQEHKGFINYGNSFDCNNFLTKVYNHRIKETKLFPNPVGGTLFIETIINNLEFTKIEIFDLQGRCVLKTNSNQKTPMVTIDVQKLNNGLYWLRLSNRIGENILFDKFLKE